MAMPFLTTLPTTKKALSQAMLPLTPRIMMEPHPEMEYLLLVEAITGVAK